jgi:succinate dehydrogenase / fumarate reductase flavoprotein subunit
MHAEISAGLGTPNRGVWLDLTNLSGEAVDVERSGLRELLLDRDLLDATRTAIEVAPAAHCSLGGVWVRPDDNSTGVGGLYVAGEAASGMQGANARAGDSLAELLAYGRIVGAAAARYSANLGARARSPAALTDARDELDELVARDGRDSVRTVQRELRDTMTAHAGAGRDAAGLVEGLSALAALESRVRHVRVDPDVSSPHDLAHAFDLKSSLVAARATLECALERRESRGCHQRYDAPLLDPLLQVNLVWSGPGQIEREAIPAIPAEIAALMAEGSFLGWFAE